MRTEGVRFRVRYFGERNEDEERQNWMKRNRNEREKPKSRRKAVIRPTSSRGHRGRQIGRHVFDRGLAVICNLWVDVGLVERRISFVGLDRLFGLSLNLGMEL
jgi:hypothetical protein